LEEERFVGSSLVEEPFFEALVALTISRVYTVWASHLIVWDSEDSLAVDANVFKKYSHLNHIMKILNMRARSQQTR